MTVPRFELRQLDAFDDERLIGELRRVSELLGSAPLTRQAFDDVAKVASSTITRRFHGWRSALERAGLTDRYVGPAISQRMLKQDHRGAPDSEVLAEVQRVAQLADSGLTRAFFDQHAKFHSATLTRRFGSWANALKRAGVALVPHGRRYTEDEYFENILTVWTHLGRQPFYREMAEPPSCIPPGAYEKRFQGWRRALAAFVERVSEAPQAPTVAAEEPAPSVPALPAAATTPKVRRQLPLALRYDVLRRDRFRCVICGRTPASTPGLELHVDHIAHWSRGGTNDRENLRSLCNHCNLGRGVKSDEHDTTT